MTFGEGTCSLVFRKCTYKSEPYKRAIGFGMVLVIITINNQYIYETTLNTNLKNLQNEKILHFICFYAHAFRRSL